MPFPGREAELRSLAEGLLHRIATFILIPIAFLASISVNLQAEDRVPNIILILVDDMGYSDLGCYGGEIQTPHIDALARGGLRFSTFYNAGRCCPTRASLLTGLYAHQTGVGRMTRDEKLPGYRGRLMRNCVTIAEVLRDAGYHTAMAGKWHLSVTEMLPRHMRHLNNQLIRPTFSDVETYPVSRGFDRHYGIIWGVVNFFDPFTLVNDLEPVRSVPEDYYITDALNDYAVRCLEEHDPESGPIFLYLAHTAPHWPLHALPEDIEKYQDTYTAGWRPVRDARYRRQVEMGLIDPQTCRLSPRHPAEANWATNEHRDWDARAMAVHAAMIDRVDQGLGRVIAKLKEKQMFDNTLILFLSDNGASPERPGVPGFDRVSETRDGRPVQYFGPDMPRDRLPGDETTVAGIGPMWANVSNTPFRYWKGSHFEGGIRTPMIAHWPAGLTAKANSITHQPGHLIDVMATCLEVAGLDYPEEYDGHAITPLEGRSLLPILEGRERAGHAALYFEHYDERAMREGDWKLVAAEKSAWELYDLRVDQSELNNVAAEHPERVEAMVARWQAWAERCGVLRPAEE
ncbi:MAG: arylsulfatase [Planctomycetota bacterium]|nr:MAG: arylsulfatase [Planctomycetota bacterium]